MIEDFKKHIPPEIAQRSGKVFYSGRAAFSGDRPLYILGYNPGGNPLAPANAAETVAAHTQKVFRDTPPNWSAYRNESWEGGPGGQKAPAAAAAGFVGTAPGRSRGGSRQQYYFCEIQGGG